MTNLPFDFAMPEARGPADTRTPMTVTALSRRIESALEQGLPTSVQVGGEVANHTVRNGHHYWTLRDDTARIDCVMWASDARTAKAHALDGAQMVATGRVVHWGRGGRTQLKVRALVMAGAGERLAQLRARCDDYRARGLLDDARKRPLPTCPRRVAVLTAATGAAKHDVIATAHHRFPGCGLLLVDIPVQGATAAGRIAEAIRVTGAAAAHRGLDALILARGGGSIEDLWAFNEAVTADAVLACPIPVVAAIGHESDTTLVELVADQRASTPTQAVMLLLPDQHEAAARVDQISGALHRATARRIQNLGADVESQADALSHGMHRLLRSHRDTLQHRIDALTTLQPEARLARRRGVVQAMAQRLNAATAARIAAARGRVARQRPRATTAIRLQALRATLATLDRTLHAVDPQHVLDRGFTLTVDQRGTLIRSPEQVTAGQQLTTRTAAGSFDVRVDDDAVPSPHGSQED